MTTPNLPRNQLASAVAGAMEFAGFNDWFEIFEGGEQTDSQGRTRNFTAADLDSVVANHKPAPLVIGHPKTTSAAYGWSSELKRDGLKLLAKASDVPPEFETAVKAKHFPKRSSSFESDGNGGLRLRHIGFLGGTPPAVSTLKNLEFSESENAITFEFSMPGFEDKTRWSFNGIASAFRSLRDWMISSQDLETADRVLPEYMVADLQTQADAMREERNFAKSPQTPEKKPETPMSEFSQQDVDAAVADERTKREAAEQRIQTMEYEAKVAKANTLIEDLVKKGCLLPAQREGFAEFMAQLSDNKEQTFEFSAADKTTVKQTPYEFTVNFLGQLKPQIKTGADDREDAEAVHSNFSAPHGAVVNDDRAKLHARAMEYSRKNNVSYEQAASILEQE